MLDVGGQRSERRKWIHCFENVTAVLFCVAMRFEKKEKKWIANANNKAAFQRVMPCFLVYFISNSEYDQVLREDLTQNRMLESLTLFDEICNSNWFKRSTIILFLNKTDLFQQKIAKTDLNVCFKNYTGNAKTGGLLPEISSRKKKKNLKSSKGGLNYENASSFVKSRFVEKNYSQRPLYIHFTCALSTTQIEFVFRAVKDVLLRKLLEEVMLYWQFCLFIMLFSDTFSSFQTSVLSQLVFFFFPVHIKTFLFVVQMRNFLTRRAMIWIIVEWIWFNCLATFKVSPLTEQTIKKCSTSKRGFVAKCGLNTAFFLFLRFVNWLVVGNCQFSIAYVWFGEKPELT